MLNTQHAFTMIELIITLSLISILLLLTLPNFHQLSLQTKDNIALDQLLHTIHLTRTAAITHNQTVTLCATEDKKTCANNWRNDQIIFLDPENNGIIQNQNEIISTIQSHVAGQLFWRAPLNHPFLQFQANGMTHADNGSFWYCSSNVTKPNWAIRISKSGRTRVVYPDKNGNIINEEGKVLLCP